MKAFQSEAMKWTQSVFVILVLASQCGVAKASMHTTSGSSVFLGVSDPFSASENKNYPPPTTAANKSLVKTSNPKMAQLVHTSLITHYGKSACPCVGIDNLPGVSGATLDDHHVEYTLEAGASCAAWDDGLHPACESGGATWCKQKWCYVDPCNCNIDILPKMTQMQVGGKTGVTFKGMPAYWSYATCGGIDYYTSSMSKDACVMQKDAYKCSQNPKCAWDGKRCGGKEAVTSCIERTTLDPITYGEEDCRCVGLGRNGGPGRAYMYINEHTRVKYPPEVGATCKAWEADVHPDCLAGGSRPSWCDQKWCFVDPCKCKASVPPKVVMEANSYMKFQGKTAYWSYATCGSTDTWSSSGAGQYCVNQKSEAACTSMKKCGWTGKECMGIALAEICAVQEATGILGMESGLERSGIFMALLIAIAATMS